MLRRFVRLLFEKLEDKDSLDEPLEEPVEEPEKAAEPEQEKPKWWEVGNVAPPEAPADGPYEEYLFGDQRKEVDEPNTPDEQKLFRTLISHYAGGDWGSNFRGSQAEQLRGLRDKGHYTKWLEVPQKYTKAYRLMDNIDEDSIDMMLGDDDESHEMGYGGREDNPHYKTLVDINFGGTYHSQGEISSWTVDKSAILQMAEDEYFRISTEYPDPYKSYVAIVVVDLGAERDNFLLNPDAINRLEIPGKFAYQKEIISMGSIVYEKMVVSQAANEDWQIEREAMEDWDQGEWDEDDEDRPDITQEYDSLEEYDYHHTEEYQAHRQLVVKAMMKHL